jgi:hypothetical protein
MSLLPRIPNPYLEASTGGLLYGLLFRTSAYLQNVTSCIAGIGAGFRKRAALFRIRKAPSPILLLDGATGWLLNKATLFRKWISIIGAVALTVLGPSALLNANMVTYS